MRRLTRFKPFVTSYYKKSLINIVYSRPKRIRLRHSKKKMWKEILSKKHLKCNHPYRGHAWNTRCVQHCAAPSHSYAYDGNYLSINYELHIVFHFWSTIECNTQTESTHTHTHCSIRMGTAIIIPKRAIVPNWTLIVAVLGVYSLYNQIVAVGAHFSSFQFDIGSFPSIPLCELEDIFLYRII